MASGSKDEKAGAPALDDVKTERDAEAASRAKGAGGASAADSTPAHEGDSPKPHGDKMQHAVDEAARGPSEDKG